MDMVVGSKLSHLIGHFLLMLTINAKDPSLGNDFHHEAFHYHEFHDHAA